MKEEALKTLISGVMVAQAKGAYTLEDSATLLQAIRVLQSPEEKEVLPEKLEVTKED